ncbi:MAG: DUF4230 domain-containing protein [Anaerovoracaceae bacterium]|nr:DUF4230 domain-containing protein [Bacillota bacterium]MDD7734027.1 DUF4230 domain-containing protein [Bacillota bacterium]MDY5906257.1 DUF4230 domain-containing protein [Anaerovoracaceae bacterium]
MFVLTAAIYSGGADKKTHEIADIASVDKICELATLKCYYHDVAEYEKQAEGLFKYRPFKYGYKKVWIEYDGIVDVGIDVSDVQINEPDRKGIVRIYVPDAKILSVSADKDTMSEPLADKGIFTKITAEDKNKAFADAQATMQKNAEADAGMLAQAKNNAKELLEQYVINVGEQTGKTYKVEWLEKPIK